MSSKHTTFKLASEKVQQLNLNGNRDLMQAQYCCEHWIHFILSSFDRMQFSNKSHANHPKLLVFPVE